MLAIWNFLLRIVFRILSLPLQFNWLYLSCTLFNQLNFNIMKKPIKILAAVAAVAAGFAFALPKGGPRQINVVIDAAHGGKDYGAVYGGAIEKEIADQVADRIIALNKDEDVIINVTRADDTFLELKDRVNTANAFKADLVLSLHANSYINDVNKRGIKLYVSRVPEKYEQSAAYATQLSDSFIQKGYMADVEQAPFYLLKHSEAPAIQIEMGYLTNDADRELLTTEAGQDAIAGTVLDFIKTLK
jgi:N-acetylmuramoyl-L-alanine amidase